MVESDPGNKAAVEIERLLEQLGSGKKDTGSQRRFSPWWLVVATLIASPMLPLATFIFGMVQSQAEQARGERELSLAEQAQIMSQERDWLQIAVDPARPEAQRRQVLRFLAKGEGRIAEWAREELEAVETQIAVLQADLADTEAALDAALTTNPCSSEKAETLTTRANAIRIRLGQSPIATDPNERGTCKCGADIWQTMTMSTCIERCRSKGSGRGLWVGEMTGVSKAFGADRAP